jgi:hypothetical protein
MDIDIEFLRGYLEDEFSAVEGAHIRIVLPSGTARSVDLHQDYDPNANQLHTQRGVRVIVGSRDYFFPAEWVKREMKLVYAQVAEMRDYLG